MDSKTPSTLISAIDIGSNAIRMIVAKAEKDRYLVIKKFRSAIRLGADTFNTGYISKENMVRVEKTFREFHSINRKLGVTRCRAIATSATREALNSQEFVDFIKPTGITIEVIPGDVEANMLFKAVSFEVDLDRSKSLLMDIGGGSIEVTHVEKGKVLSSQSFPVGTVRLLNALRERGLKEENLRVLLGEFLAPLVAFFKKTVSHSPIDFMVGTGGNFEAMADLKRTLLKRHPAQTLTMAELTELASRLESIALKDRIQKLKLRPDRADVIIPAILLAETVMRQSNCNKLMIPKVGLRDGIILSMMDELKKHPDKISAGK